MPHRDRPMRLPDASLSEAALRLGRSELAAPDLRHNRVSDGERLAGSLASATSANAPRLATPRVRKPAVRTARATRRTETRRSGLTWDRKCAHQLRIARRGTRRRHNVDPSQDDDEPSAAGYRTRMCVGVLVLRSPMVRIAPRLGSAGCHREVTPQRHSVIEKASSDPLPRKPPDDLPVVGGTHAGSCTDWRPRPSARGAPPSRRPRLGHRRRPRALRSGDRRKGRRARRPERSPRRLLRLGQTPPPVVRATVIGRPIGNSRSGTSGDASPEVPLREEVADARASVRRTTAGRRIAPHVLIA